MADPVDLKGAPWTDAEDVVLSRLQVRPAPPPDARSPRLSDARLFAMRQLRGHSRYLHRPSPQAKYGNRWATVAEEMPGRTGQQCAQRWRHKVNPNIRKDKWSDDEDAKVRAHIARHRPETARTH
jgi:hypothetical protein